MEASSHQPGNNQSNASSFLFFFFSSPGREREVLMYFGNLCWKNLLSVRNKGTKQSACANKAYTAAGETDNRPTGRSYVCLHSPEHPGHTCLHMCITHVCQVPLRRVGLRPLAPLAICTEGSTLHPSYSSSRIFYHCVLHSALPEAFSVLCDTLHPLPPLGLKPEYRTLPSF